MYSLAPREAVCDWIANNYKERKKWSKNLPTGFPKTLEVLVVSDGLKIVIAILGAIGIVQAAACSYGSSESKKSQWSESLSPCS